MRRASLFLVGLALTVTSVLAVPTRSGAEMWCAEPLWAHEWGVVVFAGGRADRAASPGLPSFFHTRPGAPSAAGAPVRHLPVDGGERDLPIVQLYSPGSWRPVPLGLEVGFAHGEATRWYPQVDGRRSAADANGPSARAARDQLLAARRGRQGLVPSTLTPLGRDPTRQLAWDHLVLEDAPRHAPSPSTLPWVQRLRGQAGALWVSGASESERFVFYEARTTETAAIVLERGPTHGPGRRHVLLRNVSSHDVHDVFLVHREGAATYVFTAATIPAGRSTGLVLEEHRVAAADLAARTRGALRDALVDPHEPAPPARYAWGGPNGCTMQRDPALPVEQATDHHLYAAEVDAILEVWGARAFDAPGTTIVYRESVAHLDEVMPLSFYTDMYHFVVPRRLGLAITEGVALP
jgi:hypothetical protein